MSRKFSKTIAVLCCAVGLAAGVGVSQKFDTAIHVSVENAFEEGINLARWQLAGAGVDLAKDYIIRDGANSTYIGYAMADSLLSRAEVAKLGKNDGSEEWLAKLDTSKRDALLMSLLDSGMSNVELSKSLATNAGRFNDDARDKLISLDSGSSESIKNGTIASLKSNLTAEQKQTLNDCFEKIRGYSSSTWQMIYHSGEAGACSTQEAPESNSGA